MSQLSASGSVLGIDVGCSPTKRSSAVCLFSWDAYEIEWSIQRFRAQEPERSQTILEVAGQTPIVAAAFDGPLRRDFDIIGRYRIAEQMLTRRLQPLIGKPGQSSAPVGRLLNEHANACARIVLAGCEIAPAVHSVAIDDRAIVEAFPSAFLGVMIEDPVLLQARRGDRSDTFFVHLASTGVFDRLIGHLLPGRTLKGSLARITNHDDRAAFVCALSALAVAAGDYVAVGNDDGWIMLPPSSFVQPWATELLRTNERDTGMGSLRWVSPQ